MNSRNDDRWSALELLNRNYTWRDLQNLLPRRSRPSTETEQKSFCSQSLCMTNLTLKSDTEDNSHTCAQIVFPQTSKGANATQSSRLNISVLPIDLMSEVVGFGSLRQICTTRRLSRQFSHAALHALHRLQNLPREAFVLQEDVLSVVVERCYNLRRVSVWANASSKEVVLCTRLNIPVRCIVSVPVGLLQKCDQCWLYFCTARQPDTIVGCDKALVHTHHASHFGLGEYRFKEFNDMPTRAYFKKACSRWWLFNSWLKMGQQSFQQCLTQDPTAVKFPIESTIKHMHTEAYTGPNKFDVHQYELTVRILSSLQLRQIPQRNHFWKTIVLHLHVR